MSEGKGHGGRRWKGAVKTIYLIVVPNVYETLTKTFICIYVCFVYYQLTLKR